MDYYIEDIGDIKIIMDQVNVDCVRREINEAGVTTAIERTGRLVLPLAAFVRQSRMPRLISPRTTPHSLPGSKGRHLIRQNRAAAGDRGAVLARRDQSNNGLFQFSFINDQELL
ncbi:hypothetical protein V6X62_06385 [Spiribacter sp. 218]|uniref:hypothetical protein n=1 Tax=Spiribacter pallidus TaxID=1987936 RepID=UPI00349F3139